MTNQSEINEQHIDIDTLHKYLYLFIISDYNDKILEKIVYIFTLLL